MSKMVLITGSNGAGKSSVMRSIIGDDYEIREHPFGDYTVSKTRKIIALGKYDNPCGGCDGIKTTFLVYNLADKLSREFPDYDIYLEGMMISRIFGNVAKFFMEMLFEHHRRVLVFLLYTDPYTSVSRVLSRNGGKFINQAGIADRVEGAKITFRKHRNLGLYECKAFDAITRKPDEIASEILAF